MKIVTIWYVIACVTIAFAMFWIDEARAQHAEILWQLDTGG
jgi:uncharacterized membrane protein YsdA (DUF1294 family)